MTFTLQTNVMKHLYLIIKNIRIYHEKENDHSERKVCK